MSRIFGGSVKHSQSPMGAKDRAVMAA